LPHRFTLAIPTSRDSAVCFLWHCPWSCDRSELPTTLFCGARTFLSSPFSDQRTPNRLGNSIIDSRTLETNRATNEGRAGWLPENNSIFVTNRAIWFEFWSAFRKITLFVKGSRDDHRETRHENGI
jgi:hypothetical protein